jgi:hypothetical protein
MNIKQAREYYDLGVLTKIYLVRDPMTTGWLLVLEGKEERSWTLQTALGAEKVYSSLDSAVVEVERITNRVSSLTIGI